MGEDLSEPSSLANSYEDEGNLRRLGGGKFIGRETYIKANTQNQKKGSVIDSE